mgnify:FL=1
MITKEDMKAWAETYEEAIETLMWVVNNGYTKEDMIEAILEFKRLQNEEED